MRKIYRTIALCAVLGMVTVGCQDETIFKPLPNMDENSTLYTVRYTVDGMTFQESIRGEQGWTEFMQRMFALVNEGKRVAIGEEGATRRIVSAKEVVTFTTYDEKEANAWALARIMEGYEVEISQHPQTGEYICVATR